MNHYFFLVLLFFACISTTLAVQVQSIEEQKDEQGRKAKRKDKYSKSTSPMFSLFSVVTFQNLGCRSQEPGRNGTCFTSTECTDKGGKKSGSCAAGFGVCCLFIYQNSGATVTQNCSYIQSPNFPSTFTASEASTLTYTIHKCSSDVCALRLDFPTFTTSRDTVSPALENNGCADVFTISSSNEGTSNQLCGENSGQHIYWELGEDASATATISMTFSTAAAIAGSARNFEIKVSQIPCAADYRPASGCFQYHQGLTGRITTFNWDATTAQTQTHLANQRYNICVRPGDGMCCIRYTLCDFVDTITAAMAHLQPSYTLDGSGAAITVDTNTDCIADYIEIDGATTQCNNAPNAPTTSRICGLVFGAHDETMAMFGASTVCDCTAPFNIGIVTDATEPDAPGAVMAAIADRGICLDYQQIPCQN